MAKRTEIIARGLLIRDGHVLLCKSLAGGYLYLPGGHVEFGEGCRDALAREFVEEAGVRVRVGALAGVSEATFEQGGKRRHEVNLVFHVELPGPRRGKLPPVVSQENEITFEWVPQGKAGKLDVRPAAAKRLIRAKAVRFDSDLQ